MTETETFYQPLIDFAVRALEEHNAPQFDVISVELVKTRVELRTRKIF